MTDDAPDLTNGDLARIFHEIGDMLELKGELVFKTVAYHRAADAIGRSPVDLVAAYRAGDPPDDPGRRQGHQRQAPGARDDRPPGLLRPAPGRGPADARRPARRSPGSAPKTVRQLNTELGIETVDDLRTGRRGRPAPDAPRHVGPDRGARPRRDRPARRPVRPDAPRSGRGAPDRAHRRLLGPTPGVRSIEPAGSFRRRKESIGDLDLLAETDQPAALVEAFTSFGLVDSVINRGGYKAAVRLQRGPQADLMVMPPGEAGTYRIHFTGSKEHNVRLRAMARDQGWSLSEKGFLRIGEDGEPLTGDAAELRTFAHRGGGVRLPRPALHRARAARGRRRDRGGAGRPAAAARRRLADLRGDLHSHSDWSDGHHPIEVMAEAARRARLCLPGPDRPLAVARDRARPDARTGSRSRSRSSPRSTPGSRRRRPPGPRRRRPRPRASASSTAASSRSGPTATLDFEDDLLARFDLVVASVHVGRRQTRAELTQRTLNAIRSPHVDVIAHPSGRKIGQRDDLDLDWDAVYTEAARTGTALEMNGSPPRLDLAVERARRAVGLGCLVSIDSDAHDIRELDYVRWGISQARRAWITPASVLNTRSRADLLAWVAGKPAGVGCAR